MRLFPLYPLLFSYPKNSGAFIFNALQFYLFFCYCVYHFLPCCLSIPVISVQIPGSTTLFFSQIARWAFHFYQLLPAFMPLAFVGFYIKLAKEFLLIYYVGAFFQLVGGEAMAQGKPPANPILFH